MEQPSSKNKPTASAASSVALTDIIFRVLRSWPWVLASVIICMGLGTIHLLRTPKMYTRTASILILDKDGGRSIGGNNEFDGYGLFQSDSNIQNELATISSSSIMEEVVKRLNLYMNYFSDGSFHRNVVYGFSLPINVRLLHFPENEYASFDLVLNKGGECKLSGFTDSEGNVLDNSYTLQVGDTIKTIIGELTVIPTPFYTKDSSADLSILRTPTSAAVASYRFNLVATRDSDRGTVVSLTFTDESIQRADDILATVIEVYNENWIREKNQIAVSTSEFINDRLGVIEGELGNVESDISSFKSANMITDVTAVSSLYMGESQRASQELLELNNQLQLTRYIRSWLTSGKNDQMLPSVSSVANVDIQGQLTEYNNRILARNNLVSKSSDKNPLVVSIDEQLAAMRNAIIESVDNSIVALNTQIKSFQNAQAKANSKIASSPNQAKYLLSVERQQKVKESLYLFLLQKREENELSQAFTAYNTRIVERPGGSYAPTSPDSNKILMASFLIGLAIPIAIIYLLETTNTKLRGRKDVEDMAIPFLGEIPTYVSPEQIAINKKRSAISRSFHLAVDRISLLINKKPKSSTSTSNKRKELAVRSGKRDVINEAFRVLRTNVEFMRTNKDQANVILITSFNPGSGKSFISANLAASLALKNRKVLVIDGDLRHGSASQYIGSPEEGLSSYLNGSANDISRLIVNVTEYTNMSILPIGTIPPNPTELLETPRFGSLIESLRDDFDYILIDCPPIEVVADAQIINQFVDRAIFVVRAGLLERSMLPELDRLYKEKKYREMALVLNATNNEASRYGYSHSYRYGYGYGYGYGYNYNQKD